MDACIKIFKKDLKYNRTCYTAKLPFTDNTIALPDNYLLTKKRTENLIKLLQKYEKLLKDYNAILSKHIEEGILEDVTNETYVTNCHYLPHHPVLREDGLTTKIRIVFGASAKYHDEKSLNDILDKGILLEFCVGKIDLIGGIKQTFLQIFFYKNDQIYLRLSWLDNGNDPAPKIKIFHFTLLAFGLSSDHLFLTVQSKLI